jgi:hypothetical protein
MRSRSPRRTPPGAAGTAAVRRPADPGQQRSRIIFRFRVLPAQVYGRKRGAPLFCKDLERHGMAWPHARLGARLSDGGIAATASQWRRNAERLQPWLTHNSWALVFWARMANDHCCWQQRALRFFTPHAEVPMVATRKAGSQAPWGPVFFFALAGWRRGVFAPLCAPFASTLHTLGEDRYLRSLSHRGQIRSAAVASR